jgi:glucose-1-phosphate thymidylyltransferase
LEFGLKIIDNQTDHPDNRLGAIGDLVLGLDLLGWEDDVLILPSDTLVSLSLDQLLHFYEERQGFTNVVFDTKDPSVIAGQLGCAKLAGDRLVEFVEKPAQPASTLTSVPVYLYPQADLALLREYELHPGNNLDSPGAIIPWLIGRTITFGYQIEGYYFDVGTPEAYNRLLHNQEI